jgi:hypothetical protein
MGEERERRLRQSERLFDYSVAVISEQYEATRQQIDGDYRVPHLLLLVLMVVVGDDGAE